MVLAAFAMSPLAMRAADLAAPTGLSSATPGPAWEKELAAYTVTWLTPSEESTETEGRRLLAKPAFEKIEHVEKLQQDSVSRFDPG